MGPYTFIEGNTPGSVTDWSSHQNNSGNDVFYFSFTQLAMQLVLSADHQTMISCQIIDTYWSFPRKAIDPLREEVRSIMRTALGDDSCNVREFDLQIAILQMLEAIHEFELGQGSSKPEKYERGYAADEVSDWNEVINNPFGLDVSTIQDTAYSILRKTPEELTAGIPKEWRVIHMESVLRHDLVRRFWNYQESLKTDLKLCGTSLRDRIPPHSKLGGQVRAQLSQESILQDMISPRVTFHGTPLQSVGSIVRHGFKMPGNIVEGKAVASPRSGIAFDRGIYSSQEAFYAISYARGQREMTPVGMLPSMRLFVCATIMGRTYTGSDGRHGPLIEGYDSHFDGGFEYIVHDERAIIPCYVIHLDLGSEAAKQALKDVQTDPEEFHNLAKTKKRPEAKSTAPGDIQREKEARKAAALKWFPYGFGPAMGTRFVIEEVGEISDDEEEYGDWQADKHGYSNSYLEKNTVWDDEDGEYYDENGNLVKEKRRLMDQYQHATRAYKNKRGA
ncbi:uncharacterized protein FOBCDRAFT_123411 [Fusarium oxysporum Fo47]|uniref:Uncharacterized protein n=1 Tax=Fusarium oxysporum Fo47 TaxID=660027 RepID=W9L479_FUSOX|nr:uncharacterized protein FOBCDRAFT_123411 [Fusarium oxysporum Fo47]EWZ49789.1 hypothetical protein FOZG_00603 [Fusarium oxysporum Fo47]QKD48013.1 hypothetical protein FOBCDRAFT_123411 [Fusarium oxysporum Fo47]